MVEEREGTSGAPCPSRDRTRTSQDRTRDSQGQWEPAGAWDRKPGQKQDQVRPGLGQGLGQGGPAGKGRARQYQVRPGHTRPDHGPASATQVSTRPEAWASQCRYLVSGHLVRAGPGTVRPTQSQPKLPGQTWTRARYTYQRQDQGCGVGVLRSRQKLTDSDSGPAGAHVLALRKDTADFWQHYFHAK